MQLRITILKSDRPAGAPTEFEEFMGRLQVFALGALWAVSGAAASAFLDILTTWWNHQPLDWPSIERSAVKGMALLLVPYYLKHKALLAMPPTIQAKLNQAQALTESAGQQMVEKAQDAATSASEIPAQVQQAAKIQDVVATLSEAKKE